MLGDYVTPCQINQSKCVKAYSTIRGGTGVCNSHVLFLAIFEQEIPNYWKSMARGDHSIYTPWQKGTSVAVFTGERRWESWGYESIGTASTHLAPQRRWIALCHSHHLILNGLHPCLSDSLIRRWAGQIWVPPGVCTV